MHSYSGMTAFETSQIILEQRRIASTMEEAISYEERRFDSFCDAAEAYEADGDIARAATMDRCATDAHNRLMEFRVTHHHAAEFLKALGAWAG